MPTRSSEPTRSATVSALMPQEMLWRLRQLANAGERSVSAEIRRACQRHVEREQSRRFVTVEQTIETAAQTIDEEATE